MVFDVYLLDNLDQEVYFYSNSISFENVLCRIGDFGDFQINECELECGEGISYKHEKLSFDKVSYPRLVSALTEYCKDFFLYNIKGTIEDLFRFEIYEHNELHLFVRKAKFIQIESLIKEIIQIEKKDTFAVDFILETILSMNGLFCEFHQNKLLRVSKEQLT